MSKKLKESIVILTVIGAIAVLSGATEANWSETFDGNNLDLSAWGFYCFPDITQTFTYTVETAPDGNKYLSLDETSPAEMGGSAFGAGFGSNEEFTDVRVGAVVNVTGDASRNYYGLAARANYIIDPDGSITGVAPGLFAMQIYVMHINWENGPANLKIDVEKIINMQNIMRNVRELDLDVDVPGLDHARSYYAELDVVGSGPVYVTGSLYEYKDGPLVARTATMVDTNDNDPWEDEGVNDEVFASGQSGIFGQSEQLHEGNPIGYHCTFDEVFSVSDGPAAVNPSPADGATGLDVNADFSWLEAAFATSRDLWFGKKGAMEKVEPRPEGTTFEPGLLEFNQTYEWRIDQIGPSGTVTGHTWSFTTGNCISVEDFESYADDTEIMAVWVDSILDYDYVFLGTDSEGNNSMQFEFENQYEPYVTEVTRTFDSPQDWTIQDVQALSLFFVGEHQNAEHLMSLILEDNSGNSWRVEHPYRYACQTDSWREWIIPLGQFSDNGVDLGSVKKLTIGMGDGTISAQPDDDQDFIYVDQISLCPAE